MLNKKNLYRLYEQVRNDSYAIFPLTYLRNDLYPLSMLRIDCALGINVEYLMIDQV
jgi:hypothetical protein